MPCLGIPTQVVVPEVGDLAVILRLHIVEAQDQAVGLLPLRMVVAVDLEDQEGLVAVVVVAVEVVEDLAE